jgi:UDP-glucose 4-epimerase
VDYAGKRVLITGGFGFIGLNLAHALRDVGAHPCVLSRSWPTDLAAFQDNGEGATLFKGDIRDSRLVERAVEGSELIFHLAGKSGSAASNSSPFEDLDVNCRGLLVLLEACRRVSPTPKIVFPSSRLVYAAPQPIPVREDAPTMPLSIYGIHKLAAERYLLLYHRLYGLRSTILRITNPYGPFHRQEQNEYGIVNWLINLAMHDRSLPIYGTGGQLRDYVHIDDVVNAMLLAGQKNEADGAILNVGSGVGVSFSEMAELIVRVGGQGTVTHVDWPVDAAGVETGDFVADTSLIHTCLGWRAATPLNTGVQDVISRYRESMAT